MTETERTGVLPPAAGESGGAPAVGGPDAASRTAPGRTRRRRGFSSLGAAAGAAASTVRDLRVEEHLRELGAEAQDLLRRTRQGVAAAGRSTLAAGRTTLTTIKESQVVQSVGRPLGQVKDLTEAKLQAMEAKLETELRTRFGGYDVSQSSAVKAERQLERYKELFRLLDRMGR
jgi:hypothetical protein